MSVFDIESQEYTSEDDTNRRQHSHCEKQTQRDDSRYNHFYYTVRRRVPTCNDKYVLKFKLKANRPHLCDTQTNTMA